MGLGPYVRVSESVSHGLGLSIAYEESKRRGRGSSTAGGHTGNGHGPRALGAGCEGRGAALGTAPAVPSPEGPAGQSAPESVSLNFSSGSWRPKASLAGQDAGSTTPTCDFCPAGEEKGEGRRTRPRRQDL